LNEHRLNQIVFVIQSEIMKNLTVLAVLVTIVLCASISNAQERTKEEKTAFYEWKKEHQKSYKTHEEEQEAMQNFFDNKEKIDEHNQMYEQGEKKFKLGLTAHADMTPEQIRKINGFNVPPEKREKRAITKIPNFPSGPDSIDWVKKGLVGPVENQSIFFKSFKLNQILKAKLQKVLADLATPFRQLL
jgi:hypothetical protein